MNPPAGYDPTVSSLPDPGASAVPMKVMMGGGSSSNTTITILGESYRIRKEVKYPLQDDERELLKAFQIDDNAEDTLGHEAIEGFFNALAENNCEKEEGVLLNPKCEPVRVVLRAAIMKSFLGEVDEERATRNLGPLGSLTDDLGLKRRNQMKLNADILDALKKKGSILEALLMDINELHERHYISNTDDELLKFIKGGNSSSSSSTITP